MDQPAEKVVLVTGAASGVGLETCRLLAQQGFKVYGATRQKDCQPAGNWKTIYMDVTLDETIEQAIQEIVEIEQRIDILVHCAGISLVVSIDDCSLNEAFLQVNTNFFGALRVIKAVFPVMKNQKSGKMIIISSMGGIIGLPYQGIYSSSKFALEGLVEALRMEMIPFGIQAALINPGDLNTPMTDKRIYARKAQLESDYQKSFNSIVKIITTNERQGKAPLEVAKLIYKIILARKLKVRYLIGNRSEKMGVWVKGILPDGLFERIMRGFYKL